MPTSATNTIAVTLDKERHLKYGWTDAKQLCRVLGGISLRTLLQRLAELDPDALTAALHLGLKHEDRKLTLDRVDELIQGYLDAGGLPMKLVAAVTDALEASGAVRVRAEGDGGSGQADPPTS